MATVYEAANKTFLTPAVDENSSIVWAVEVNHYPSSKRSSLLAGVMVDDEDEEDSSYTNVQSHITIADCSRRVCLEFEIYGDKDVEAKADQKLLKIDLLISQLEEYRQHLATAYAMKLSMDKEAGVASELSSTKEETK